ncbi:MAG: hypothetical protein WBA74_12680 [Cyclobacteriaceae bacterium]
MKSIDYILKFAFLIGVSLMTAIFLGPALLRMSGEADGQIYNAEKLKSLSVKFLNQHTTDYITLEIQLEGIYGKKNYHIVDNKHLELIKFLQEYTDNKTNSLEDLIPLSIGGKSLDSYNEIGLKVASQSIEYLSVDQHVIVGGTSSVKRVMLFGFGIIIILLGLLVFLLGLLSAINSLKQFNKTGNLPALPNTIDDMSNGIKTLFGKRDKKNDL